MSTTQNWMVMQSSLCVNFTTTTKSTTCCCSIPQRDTTCSLPSKVHLRIQKLAGHGLAISDGQAFRRSMATQVVMEMIKLFGEAKQLRVDDLC
eukprot:818810-Pleurochrysis_carterae.AAC.2